MRQSIEISPSPPVETATQALHWALRTYRDRVVLAVSFGGLGGLVLLDLALRIAPRLPVYYLDTGLLFAETLEFVRRIEAHYGIAVMPIRPQLTLAEQAARHGEALWEREPDTCCDLRKVQPQRAFLKNYDAWLSGLHRTSLQTRANLARVSWDAGANVVKVSPLALWSDDDLETYVREHAIPRNPLQADGFTSIGCMPCTRRVLPGQDPRAGRWPGFAKTECGLHLGIPSR